MGHHEDFISQNFQTESPAVLQLELRFSYPTLLSVKVSSWVSVLVSCDSPYSFIGLSNLRVRYLSCDLTYFIVSQIYMNIIILYRYNYLNITWFSVSNIGLFDINDTKQITMCF